MTIAVFSHPFCTGEMTIERMSRPGRFMVRIDMQDNARDATPVRSGRIGIEQTKICNNVFLIVYGQPRIRWGRISNIRIERRLLHTLSSK